MLKKLSLLAAVAVVASLVSGCMNMEQKLGRGLRNSYDIVRLGEMRRTIEQTALFDSPDAAYTTGVVRGFNRTLARTCLGVYEVATFPLPPYHPLFTRYLAPGTVYPDNYRPGILADSMFATDTYVGFGGGDVMPFLPGSRFSIFINP